MISQVSQFWYYDVLVFQGVLYMDIDVEFANASRLLPKKVPASYKLRHEKYWPMSFSKQLYKKSEKNLGSTLWKEA